MKNYKNLKVTKQKESALMNKDELLKQIAFENQSIFDLLRNRKIVTKIVVTYFSEINKKVKHVFVGENSEEVFVKIFEEIECMNDVEDYSPLLKLCPDLNITVTDLDNDEDVEEAECDAMTAFLNLDLEQQISFIKKFFPEKTFFEVFLKETF